MSRDTLQVRADQASSSVRKENLLLKNRAELQKLATVNVCWFAQQWFGQYPDLCFTHFHLRFIYIFLFDLIMLTINVHLYSYFYRFISVLPYVLGTAFIYIFITWFTYLFILLLLYTNDQNSPHKLITLTCYYKGFTPWRIKNMN